MKESALTYSQAKQELEEIVSAIESGIGCGRVDRKS